LHRHPAVQIAAAVGRPDAHAGEVAVAYVQLKPGACATESELLSFVKDHIRERAAVPKAIRIVPVMPLTGVGKIFKPELKHREIEDALGHALREAGVQTRLVKVCSDSRYGTRVRVSLAASADPELAGHVLGQFPFPFWLSDEALGRSS
jgi:fatty-acyl-CoA synthase